MKKLFPILLVVGGLALGAGGFFGVSKVMGKDEAPAAATKWNPEPGEGVGYVTKERVVNLADPGTLRYLKTTIVIELASPAKKGPPPKGEEYKKAQEELGKELKSKAAIVDDQINTLLGSKTSAELTKPRRPGPSERGAEGTTAASRWTSSRSWRSISPTSSFSRRSRPQMSDKLLSQQEIEALMSSLTVEPDEPTAATTFRSALSAPRGALAPGEALRLPPGPTSSPRSTCARCASSTSRSRGGSRRRWRRTCGARSRFG